MSPLLDGRYQTTEIIGRGGYGETYLAKDLRRPKHPLCVVKRLLQISDQKNGFQAPPFSEAEGGF